MKALTSVLVGATGSFLHPRRVWKMSPEEKVVYLTFDDGPVPEVTPWVLEELEKFNAQATFFCVGENILRNFEVMQQLRMSAHSIGNHTHTHLNGWRTGNTRYLDDVMEAQRHLEEIVVDPDRKKLFRPPYGKLTPGQAKSISAMGFRIVMWSLLSRDYLSNLGPEEIRREVLGRTTPGSILVFHDSLKAKKNLTAVLPGILEELQNRGYRFAPL